MVERSFQSALSSDWSVVGYLICVACLVEEDDMGCTGFGDCFSQGG